MANITLNIEGDLNIYVSEEDGQPDSLYLDGMDGFPEKSGGNQQNRRRPYQRY